MKWPAHRLSYVTCSDENETHNPHLRLESGAVGVSSIPTTITFTSTFSMPNNKAKKEKRERKDRKRDFFEKLEP
jgi:hypothetical protein